MDTDDVSRLRLRLALLRARIGETYVYAAKIPVAAEIDDVAEIVAVSHDPTRFHVRKLAVGNLEGATRRSCVR